MPNELKLSGGKKLAKLALIAIAVLLIYVLSSGPVVGFMAWNVDDTGAGEIMALVVVAFYAPLQYGYDHSPLIKSTLGWYIDLWCPKDSGYNEPDGGAD
jgi:hypothetical protein